VPLYKLARKGVEVEREPRLIHIYNFASRNTPSRLARSNSPAPRARTSAASRMISARNSVVARISRRCAARLGQVRRRRRQDAGSSDEHVHGGTGEARDSVFETGGQTPLKVTFGAMNSSSAPPKTPLPNGTPGKVCLAIGVFDGVHLGHQQIIQQTINDARQHDGRRRHRHVRQASQCHRRARPRAAV
jgi:hypothetical protein